MERDITCPDHPEACLIEDPRAGDVICTECGLVIGERLVDVGTEWRNFSDDNGRSDQNRVGTAENMLFSTGDLTTIFWGRDEGERKMMKMQQRINVSANERTLREGFAAIREIGDKMHLVESIQDSSKMVFKEMTESKVLVGKNVNVRAAACCLYACRQMKVPRTIKEISDAAGLSMSMEQVTKCFTLIRDAKSSKEARGGGVVLDLLSPEHLMPRFCGNLGLPNSVMVKASKIAKKATELHIVLGRSPVSVAAAAIYMAAQDVLKPPSYEEVAAACGTGTGTVRTIYTILLNRRRELIVG